MDVQVTELPVPYQWTGRGKTWNPATEILYMPALDGVPGWSFRPAVLEILKSDKNSSFAK